MDSTAYLYANGGAIYIGRSFEFSITYLRSYLECQGIAIFKSDVYNDLEVTNAGTVNNQGIVNNHGFTYFKNTTDATSLISTASTILDGGFIIKKNLYATDVMSNNLTTGNIGCGNLNSSNNITCVDLITDSIKCNTLYTK